MKTIVNSESLTALQQPGCSLCSVFMEPRVKRDEPGLLGEELWGGLRRFVLGGGEETECCPRDTSCLDVIKAVSCRHFNGSVP